MSLKIIKNKIRSVDKTHKVTKAMEAVSAVKMRKSQELALTSRPYAVAALTILKRVGGSVDAITSPLVKSRNINKLCILLVTSDKGLAGSLNSAVIKKAQRTIMEKGTPKESVSFVCIGNKGFDFFSKRGYTIHKHYENMADDISAEDMRDTTEVLVSLYRDEKIDQCVVIYTNFISTFEQQVTSRILLPISFDDIERIIKEILPKAGRYSRIENTEAEAVVYTIEPDPDEVLAELIPFLVNVHVYHSLLEAKASEHSARMVAMKNASDKASEMSEELTLTFNKIRQTLITREVSEIIGGMEALRT